MKRFPTAEQSYRDAWDRVVAVHGAPTCPVCAATTEWTIGGGLMVPVGDIGGTRDPTDPRSPHVRVICMRCGYTLLFDVAYFVTSER